MWCTYMYIIVACNVLYMYTFLCEGTDPEYLQEVARIKEDRDKRLFVAEAFRDYETQCAKEDFEREKSLAETEFEVHVCTWCAFRL